MLTFLHFTCLLNIVHDLSSYHLNKLEGIDDTVQNKLCSILPQVHQTNHSFTAILTLSIVNLTK